jgi:hypothetical protein
VRCLAACRRRPARELAGGGTVAGVSAWILAMPSRASSFAEGDGTFVVTPRLTRLNVSSRFVPKVDAMNVSDPRVGRSIARCGFAGGCGGWAGSPGGPCFSLLVTASYNAHAFRSSTWDAYVPRKIREIAEMIMSRPSYASNRSSPRIVVRSACRFRPTLLIYVATSRKVPSESAAISSATAHSTVAELFRRACH